jgi:hypothetical protein
MRHPEKTKNDKWRWLYALDAASECGMTITDSLADSSVFALLPF